MRLHSETRGSGPDLVMLHGWGMHSAMWGAFSAELSNQFRVTLIDLPGHGQSPALERDDATNLSAVAAAVAAVAPEQAAWLGWSLGGLVTLQGALDFPWRIPRLVLVAANACFVQRAGWFHAQPAAVLDGFAAGLRRDYRTVLIRFLALQAWGAEDVRQQARVLRETLFAYGEPQPEALSAGLTLLKETDLRGALPEINQPVLLISGQNDSLVPSAAAERMREALPNAHLVQVPGAGHAPFLFHSASFRKTIGAFLNE